MSPRSLMWSALALVLVCSCAAPLYDRAAVTRGLSYGGGLGLSTGLWPEGLGTTPGAADFERHLSLVATGFVRYGLSRTTSLFAEGSVGEGAFLSGDKGWVFQSDVPAIVDLQLGAKFALSRRNSLRLSTGLPSALEVAWLRDYAKNSTFVLGAGLRGVFAGHVQHFQLRRRLAGHLSASAAVFPVNIGTPNTQWQPALHLGFGLERMPRQ
ncbi:hypothetical protein FJY71_07565 [candidate division WOR-3 bacterium]|nr:hypothetical protein [candidate division WOR-3 bacterium]